MDFLLTEEEKEILLVTARERIREDLGLGTAEYPKPTAKMSEICGAFVTLHSRGNLRGCIGNIIGRQPLIDTVRNMAHAAAFDDPRFPSLQQGEFNKIEIEISVLSPLRRISSVDEISVGTHGIYMKRGYSAGVLLPQVPVEQGWDLMTFVSHTCLKAGLPPDAWKDPATSMEIFSAAIFSENS